MFWMLALPFVAAIAAPVFCRVAPRAAGWALALVPIAILARVLTNLPAEPMSAWVEAYAWVPDLGIELALRMDGLSAVFCVLISAIGALVLIYARGYLGDDPRLGRLQATLLAFMGSMLGVVLCDDLIALFVFWELTSITSYLLIGFRHEAKEARDAALQALLVTAAGGLALLAGFVLLIIAAGQAVEAGSATHFAGRISQLPAIAAGLQNQPLYPAAVVLILLGAWTKSAQAPFHFWLPGAMAAPTPVSAYLHSATMVKAGVYLVARLAPALGGTDLWHIAVIGGGVLTMLVGAVSAAFQHDLKRILACTTVSALGVLMMLIGVGTEAAVKAAVVFLVAHALYKAALFLVAGNIDHETGTRDVTVLRGLGRAMPVTAAAGVVAALSMAGAPPMFGFISKELLLKAKLDLEGTGYLLILLAVVANIFLIAMGLMAAVRPFFGRRIDTPRTPHEAPLSMLAGPVLLAGLGLFAGLAPGIFDATLGPAAASAIAGRPLEMKLALWHGVNPTALTALAISGVTLAAGFLLFLKLKRRLAFAVGLAARLAPFSAARAYESALAGLFRLADGQTRLLQSGYLRRYVMITLAALIAALLVPLTRGLRLTLGDDAWSIRLHEAVLAGMVLAGAVIAVFSRSRLGAVAALGASGFGVALIFAMFGAPDLAMTQIMVETLTVILLVFVFHRMPPAADRRSPARRIRDALLAAATGTILALLLVASAAVSLDPLLAREFSTQSWPLAFGRNVVNVILVDFRALDTLGEITVIAVAAVGVAALLKLRPTRSRAATQTEGRT